MRECEHSVTWLSPALLASVLLGLAAAGCGAKAQVHKRPAATSTIPGIDTALSPTQERGTIVTSAIPRGQRFRGDGDADNPGDADGNGDIDPEDGDSDYPTAASYRFPDEDDKPILSFGHRPSAAEARAITSVVTRYYAAGSAGNGSVACSLLSADFARSVPETYGQGGPPYLRGAKTCAAVIALLFRHSQKELSEPITVVAVRVSGGVAQVVLASRKIRASHVFLMREHGSWKVRELLGETLP